MPSRAFAQEIDTYSVCGLRRCPTRPAVNTLSTADNRAGVHLQSLNRQVSLHLVDPMMAAFTTGAATPFDLDLG
jgi:hypothetical protein